MVTVDTIKVTTTEELTFIDLTPDVERIVGDSHIKNGTVTVQAAYCVDSITHMEFEQGSQDDLKSWLEKVVPTNIFYQHEIYNHDDNGHSHLRASIFGASETFIIKDGKIMLNDWQQIVLIGFAPHGNSDHPVHVCVMGE